MTNHCKICGSDIKFLTIKHIESFTLDSYIKDDCDYQKDNEIIKCLKCDREIDIEDSLIDNLCPYCYNSQQQNRGYFYE